MSITHNKNLNPLLNLLINCIPAKSAPQIVSIKGDCTFLFLNFLIIGLCGSSANSLFEIVLLLIPLPEVVLSKKSFCLIPLPCHVENKVYLVRFDKYIANSCFFKFLYSFFAFWKWSISTVCKSWLS